MYIISGISAVPCFIETVDIFDMASDDACVCEQTLGCITSLTSIPISNFHLIRCILSKFFTSHLGH